MRILVSLFFLISMSIGSLAALAAQPGLTPCPASPNCVSSLASDENHYVAPLAGAGDVATTIERLTDVLDDISRVKWEQTAPNRITATFKSLIFRFVDDVDFFVREDGTIDVRSASRIGYSDLGANRRRVEDLRERLSQAPQTP